MNSFDAELNRRIETWRGQNLYRELRRVDSPPGTRIQIGGRTLLNFSSNDYLGLANDPRLREAAIRAVEKFGAGSGAARLMCGSLAPHHELEEALAAFKGTEAALSFSTGYATAIGTIGALLGRNDVIILDKLAHACLVDAARLSGATLRVFAHNDLNDLEKKLRWADRIQDPESKTQNRRRTLIVTESLFSMDGDAAPLREIVVLKEKHGAWLMVDEAHATGLCGKNRRGLAEETGVGGRIEIQMGTLGKALGAAGGFVCGSRPLVDLLVNRARSFIFSTAPVPAAAAAAAAAVQFVRSADGETRQNLLRERVGALAQAIGRPPSSIPGAIIPVGIGAEEKALAAAAALREQGLFVPAVRYPTVARGRARLRVTLTAAHQPDEIRSLASALNEIANRQCRCIS